MRPEHLKILERHYLENSNWSRQKIENLAAQLSLPHKKIYKWNWERKKKELATQTTASDAQDAQSSGQEK